MTNPQTTHQYKNMEKEIEVLEREKMAREYFCQGYNCCQSVLLAFSDILAEKSGIDKETLLKVSSGLGGGMGRLREVCGSVSAMSIIAGFLSPSTNPSDKIKKTENYALVQDFAGKFRQTNGSIICRELLQIQSTKKESPEPSDRTSEYYKVRPCEKFVGNSAKIIAEYIAESL